MYNPKLDWKDYNPANPNDPDAVPAAADMLRIESGIAAAERGTGILFVTTNSGNNYSITTDYPLGDYLEGITYRIKVNANATGNCTLKVDALAAIPIMKANGNQVTNLKAGGVYTVTYSSGNFILQGEGGEYGTATAAEVLTGYSIGTENGLVNGALSLTGNAAVGDVLSGKTFYNTNAKTKQTGTMTNKTGSATVITPGTVDQVIPQGYYGGAAGDGKVAAIPATYKRMATGNATSNSGKVSVSGLAFTPSYVIVYLTNVGNGTNYSLSIAKNGGLNQYNGAVWAAHNIYSTNTGNPLITGTTMSTSVIIANGFDIPVNFSGLNYTWVAYE